MIDDFKYEELFLLKNTLCKYKGSDPVTLNIKDFEDDYVKVLASSMFWVNSSNDLVKDLNNQFKDRLEINIKFLDTVESK